MMVFGNLSGMKEREGVDIPGLRNGNCITVPKHVFSKRRFG